MVRKSSSSADPLSLVFFEQPAPDHEPDRQSTKPHKEINFNTFLGHPHMLFQEAGFSQLALYVTQMQDNMHCNGDDEYQASTLMNLNQKMPQGSEKAAVHFVSPWQNQPVDQARHT
jgi:hypothetical protein